MPKNICKLETHLDNLLLKRQEYIHQIKIKAIQSEDDGIDCDADIDNLIQLTNKVINDIKATHSWFVKYTINEN